MVKQKNFASFKKSMKKFSAVFIIISYFISEGTSKCTKRNESFVDYNGFMQRDNSNITFVIYNNGTEVEACEMVTETYDCYKNGKLIDNVTERYMSLKYYSQNGSTSNAPFDTYFDCLNFLIRDREIKVDLEEGFKIFTKKYLGTNDDITNNIIRVKNGKSKDLEVFYNNELYSKIFHTKERIFSESYESQRYFEKLIEFGTNGSAPFLPDPASSFLPDNYTKYEEKFIFSSSWTRKSVPRNVKVPANSGKIFSQKVRKVYKLKEYTANFLIDDLEEEDSQRFKIFQQKLKNGEVSLHQRENDVYFDFTNDNSIELKNLPIREYTNEVTTIYSLKVIKKFWFYIILHFKIF